MHGLMIVKLAARHFVCVYYTVAWKRSPSNRSQKFVCI